MEAAEKQKGDRMEQSVEAMSTIPTRMYEAWNRGDVAGFFADFAEDVVFAELEGTIYQSRAEAIAAHEDLLGTVMKGSQPGDDYGPARWPDRLAACRTTRPAPVAVMISPRSRIPVACGPVKFCLNQDGRSTAHSGIILRAPGARGCDRRGC
jgi:uncharacterized protein (TIGR02246 family)